VRRQAQRVVEVLVEGGVRDAGTLGDPGGGDVAVALLRQRLRRRRGQSLPLVLPDQLDFLADGGNDKKFSSRIIEIAKTTDGPPGVGTVYASTAKDGGIRQSTSSN
jgi:hypothetical protein